MYLAHRTLQWIKHDGARGEKDFGASEQATLVLDRTIRALIGHSIAEVTVFRIASSFSAPE